MLVDWSDDATSGEWILVSTVDTSEELIVPFALANALGQILGIVWGCARYARFDSVAKYAFFRLFQRTLQAIGPQNWKNH